MNVMVFQNLMDTEISMPTSSGFKEIFQLVENVKLILSHRRQAILGQ